MEKEINGNVGQVNLIRRIREAFRIPENINHYSDEDYRIAERKFVKLAMKDGEINLTKPEKKEEK